MKAYRIGHGRKRLIEIVSKLAAFYAGVTCPPYLKDMRHMHGDSEYGRAYRLIWDRARDNRFVDDWRDDVPREKMVAAALEVLLDLKREFP